jgi:lipopolysaccharide transport system permease protein
MGVLLSMGLFLHPIFYPPSSVPPWLENAFAFSPFSHLIWCFRDALFDGTVVHPWSWLIAPACGIVGFALGWRIFRTLRPTFGNAL